MTNDTFQFMIILDLDILLMDAFQDSDTGSPIWYLFNGNIFNFNRLQAKTKVQTDVLHELLYADGQLRGKMISQSAQ